ncbi:protein translocase subunit SecF, partial [Luedemannella flava]|uniref:protein translocase subunit SecF n=1 Tax=Luedemannella flava TaxID=349316 RepID=UPI0031E0BE6A
MSSLATRLYNGEAGIDVVGRRKIWYSIAAVIVVLAGLSFWLRGVELGIDFKGGNSFQVPASVGTIDHARDAVADAGAEVITAQKVGTGPNATYLIKTADLDAAKAETVKEAVASKLALNPEEVSDNRVSASWGAQILRQALIGVLIFLVLVVAYLIAVFREWRMAVAAIAALVQNLLLTATVYMLVGFEVSPSTVIGFLTILGFALYDVVVVFDKVRENTRGITGKPDQTYGEAANLAVNQTMMRSINTGVVALLPVGGLLFIGAGVLKAGTLKDLGLVLFVGMLSAVYSSIFFATPVLVDLKEREPRFKAHKQRVLARRAAGGGSARLARAADGTPATPTVAAA